MRRLFGAPATIMGAGAIDRLGPGPEGEVQVVASPGRSGGRGRIIIARPAIIRAQAAYRPHPDGLRLKVPDIIGIINVLQVHHADQPPARFRLRICDGIDKPDMPDRGSIRQESLQGGFDAFANRHLSGGPMETGEIQSWGDGWSEGRTDSSGSRGKGGSWS